MTFENLHIDYSRVNKDKCWSRLEKKENIC